MIAITSFDSPDLKAEAEDEQGLLSMFAECMRSNASVFAESADGELSILWTLISARIDHDKKQVLIFLDAGHKRIAVEIKEYPESRTG